MTGQEHTGNHAETIVDNRMSFIRLLEAPQEREYSGEYEVASEVRIVGQLTYGNGDIILRFLTPEANRDGLYKYTLSISAPAQYRLPTYQASADGYYFEGGGPEEILSLASLYLRCRFFPVAYVFRDIGGPPMSKVEHDFSYVRPQKNIDQLLFDKTVDDSTRNFVDLVALLDDVKKLPEDFHHRFANAVRLYALAVREIGVNDQLAYVHLVSSIEILSKYQPLTEILDPLQDVMEHIENVLSTASTEAKSELGNLFEQRKTMSRFIEFVASYSTDVIQDRPETEAVEGKIYRDNLADALKRIYRGRSKFLHEGSAMYMGFPRMSAEGADYDISMGQTIDNRVFAAEEKLPNIVFFEGLVRSCLLKYLEDKATQN